MGVSAKLPILDFINAATGWNMTPDEFLMAGERIQTMRQVFNFRQGVRPDDFQMPHRLKQPPVFQGPLRGNDLIYDYKKLKDAYYRAMQWDVQTGAPSKERMAILGFEHIWDE